MPIRYKVVRIAKGGERFSATLCPWENKFSLKYPKNSVVVSPENTLGIMTFVTKKEAHNFRSWNLSSMYEYKIVKVRGIGRGRKVEWVLSCTSSQNINWLCEQVGELGIQKAFKAFLTGRQRVAPNGTICYKSIEVLE